MLWQQNLRLFLVLFLLVRPYLENLHLHCHQIILFLFLCIYHSHHKQVHYQIFIFNNFSTLCQIWLYLFSNLLSLILKDIVLLLSKFLTYPIICGSFIYDGFIASLSLYSIKYLKVFFEPYGSSLETNILSKSMSSILITFFFL